MDVIHERCAGIDISKVDVKVTIRVPGAGRRRRRETRTFSSMTSGLLTMRAWLLDEGITVAGMEATGAPTGSPCSTCSNTTWRPGSSTPGT